MFEVKFDEKATDEELIETITHWEKESTSYHEELLQVQEKSIKYYEGNQTSRDRIPTHNSDTVDNKIFAGTETIVPIVTAQMAQFVAIPAKNDELSLKSSQKLQTVLTRKFEDLRIKELSEEAMRDVIIKRFGVFKWGWDKETDDVGVEVIDPRFILIPKLKLPFSKLPYKMEIQEYTRDEIEAEFPDLSEAKIDELAFGKKLNTGEDDNSADTHVAQVLEVWTSDYVAWRQGDVILDRKVNPYFDFEGTKEDKELRFFNHLDTPRDPYVALTTFRLRKNPVGDTSLTEIAIPLQDAINTGKRKIIDNIVMMGNNQWVMDAGAMSKEERNKITNEAGLIIEGERLASEGRMRKEPAAALPSSHFASLQDSKISFDEVFGVNPSTRGSGASKTLGQDILNRQQDLTRIDLLTRVLNRGIGELADGITQLMKMFYDGRHIVKILGSDGDISFIPFSRKDIEDGVIINVKEGQPTPTDPAFISNQAIQLWQLGALAPQDLFARLGFEDPRKMAEKLLGWKQGQLLQETNARIAEAEAGAVASAKAAGGERGAETSNNSIQRSTDQLGGGAAKLPKSPKIEGSKNSKEG